jgi:hypothetical protein
MAQPAKQRLQGIRLDGFDFGFLQAHDWIVRKQRCGIIYCAILTAAAHAWHWH